MKGARWFRSWRLSGDHPNDSIIENGQNNEKNPGDLRRLAVTQIPVKTISSRWCEKTTQKKLQKQKNRKNEYNFPSVQVLDREPVKNCKNLKIKQKIKQLQ